MATENLIPHIVSAPSKLKGAIIVFFDYFFPIEIKSFYTLKDLTVFLFFFFIIIILL